MRWVKRSIWGLLCEPSMNNCRQDASNFASWPAQNLRHMAVIHAHTSSHPAQQPRLISTWYDSLPSPDTHQSLRGAALVIHNHSESTTHNVRVKKQWQGCLGHLFCGATHRVQHYPGLFLALIARACKENAWSTYCMFQETRNVLPGNSV